MAIMKARLAAGRPTSRVFDQVDGKMTTPYHVRRRSMPAKLHEMPTLIMDFPLFGSLADSPTSNLSSPDTVMVDLWEDNAQPEVVAAPIHSLPFEIIGDIFHKYIEADVTPRQVSTRRPCVSADTRADPIALGQVCSYWRSVALSTPSLWTNLLIKHPKFSHVYRTQLWLERAQPLGICITLEGSKTPVRTELSASRSLLQIFVSHMHSWKSINLRCSSDVLLLQDRYGSCPRLESAILQIPNSQQFVDAQTSFDVVDRFCEAIHSSPSLSRVHWGDTYCYGLPTHVPWHQLSHIQLDTPLDLEELLDILSNCHSAQTISINNLSEPSPDFIPPSPIVLRDLHRLGVVMSQPTSNDFFASLTLPSLTSLSVLHYDPEMSYRYPTSFRDFLSRSRCYLTHFQFIDECLSDNDILGYLSSPYVQTVTQLGLDIRGNNLSDRIVDAFTLKAGNEGKEIMPNLVSLQLAVCDTTDGSLSRMVASRRASPTPSPSAPSPKPSHPLTFVSFRIKTETRHPLDCNALQDMSLDGLAWNVEFLKNGPESIDDIL